MSQPPRLSANIPQASGAPAYDPLDLGTHRAFHDARKMVIQPFFQHRADFLAHDILDGGAAAEDGAAALLRHRSKQLAHRGSRRRSGGGCYKL